MDVVFYYPKFPSGKQKYVVGGGSNRMTPPLDMGWIAKLLEKEGTINFEIVDANINRYSFDEVKKILSKLQPKIILTTSEPYEAYRCMSLIEDYLSIHKDCIEITKETLPESQIILVGPHGTSFPDYVFKENPKLNFIVRGEPELTSFELINALLKGEDWREIKGVSCNNNGQIIHNEDRPYIENLDMLSYPAFHLLELEKYLIYSQKKSNKRKTMVISSRGCPYKCIYCFKAMVGTIISDFFGGNEKSDEKNLDNPLDLTLVESILEETVGHLKGENDFSSFWNSFFIKKKGEIDEEGYLTSKEKKFYYIFISPEENQSDFARAVGPIKLTRNYIKKLQDKYPGVIAGVTGPTALASDEMVTTSNDMVRASLISLAGVSLLFIISLKRLILPIIAVFTLVISLCWSLGFTTLTVGHLNILSVVFTTILIGLGIDFSIHFITRFQEEQTLGSNVTNSITNSLIGTGKGVIAGAITTSFAFMATIFTDFKGIAELGFIAGTGIIICLIATITLLPAMIIIKVRVKNTHWVQKLSKKFAFDYNLSQKIVHPFFDLLLKKPLNLILLGSFITFLSIFFIRNIRFDYNILNLQASGLESVDYEMKILNHSDRSAWYGAVIVNSFDEVLSTKKDLESLPSVNVVSSIASIVPDQQAEKINIIKEISRSFSKFPDPSKDSNPVDLNSLSNILNKINFKMRNENKDSWKEERKPQAKSIKKIRELISDFNYLVKRQKKTFVEESLNKYQIILFTDFNKKMKTFREALNPEKIVISNIPDNLKERFIGKTKKFLLQVFPKMNIYDREPMEKFISDIWSIDPNATGTAITASESSRLMKEGYIKGGIYALIAILLFVWISFRDWQL